MTLNSNIRTIFGHNVTQGTYGIEVEVEGDNLPPQVNGFDRTADGSLRGESAEFVFKGPASKSLAIKRINALYKAYADRGTVLRNSYRCSVHVHMNVQEFSMSRVATLFILYAMFEEYLVRYCGPHREGNMFCLRLKDAEEPVDTFLSCLARKRFDGLNSDRLRYAAINLAALGKYGSLEFRAMRGPDTAQEIIDWVNLLDCLRVASGRFTSPVDLVEHISLLGSHALAEEVFGDLLGTLPLDGDWGEVIFENMRMVQDIAYIPRYPVAEVQADAA